MTNPVRGHSLRFHAHVVLDEEERSRKLVSSADCFNEDDARSREKYVTLGRGKRYLQRRLKRFLSLTG